jgi:hypothetical protein
MLWESTMSNSSRAQAEVMVDTVTLLAAASVGLAVDGETIPYVAGWGEDGALEAAIEFAETIDKVARRIEDVLLVGNEPAGAGDDADSGRRGQRDGRLRAASSSRLISRTASSSSRASASVSPSSKACACAASS